MNPALRSIRIGLLAAFLGLAPAAGLLADTIYLKNGRQIQASNIVRQEGKLTFDAEGGEVTLSESLVDRIESDDPGRAPIIISKPQAAHHAAPASRPDGYNSRSHNSRGQTRADGSQGSAAPVQPRRHATHAGSYCQANGCTRCRCPRCERGGPGSSEDERSRRSPQDRSFGARFSAGSEYMVFDRFAGC